MAGKKKRTIVKTFEHPYPSRYGSHASMVSEWQRPLDCSLVICEDEKGFYVTDKDRLDSGLADIHRWAPKEHRDLRYEEIQKIVERRKEQPDEDKADNV